MKKNPSYQPPATVYQSHDFEQVVTEPADLLPVLEHLTKQTVEQLDDYHCRRVSVRLYQEDQTHPRVMTRLLKKPAGTLLPILRGARLQLKALLKTQSTVASLGLELGGLVHPPQDQGSVFFQRPAVKQVLQTLSKRFPNRLFRSVINNPAARLSEEAAHLTNFRDL